MYYSRSLLLTLLLALLVTPTQAQQGDTTPLDTASVQGETKNPTRAVLYSLSGTVALTPAFGAGLIVGPSFGHFYAGNTGHAWAGIGLRAGGGLISMIGASASFGAMWEGREGAADTYATLAVAGLGTVVGSAVYDIATADNAVHQYNRAHGLKTRVTPAVGPHSRQIGLALTIRY